MVSKGVLIVHCTVVEEKQKQEDKEKPPMERCRTGIGHRHGHWLLGGPTAPLPLLLQWRQQ